jgi:hypothetical protein
MAKRRRNIPVDFVYSTIGLSLCCAAEAQDSTGQDKSCIILAGISCLCMPFSDTILLNAVNSALHPK